MTALAPDTRASARADRAPSSQRLSFARVVRSEWIKLTTVRSTWWALAVAAVLTIGIAMMVASASADFAPGFPAINAILMPTQFTMLVAGILGAIVVTGEYSTGMIRSTLTAEPRRGAVLVAKAVVVTVLLAVTTVVIYAGAVLATSPFLAEQIDWSTPEQSIIPLAYGVLSMVAFALLGLGFGFLIRNGAGAIAATVGVLFVLPIVFSLFTLAGDAWRWIVDWSAYLPTNAASTLTAAGAEDVVPSLIALGAWVLVPLLAGWAVLSTRDA
jgi:ABC-2 type transport system permease protein